jgi:hypothetical protein
MNIINKYVFQIPMLRPEVNIQMNIKEIGCVDKGWFHLDLYKDKRRALMNAVMNYQDPLAT